MRLQPSGFVSNRRSRISTGDTLHTRRASTRPSTSLLVAMCGSLQRLRDTLNGDPALPSPSRLLQLRRHLAPGSSAGRRKFEGAHNAITSRLPHTHPLERSAQRCTALRSRGATTGALPPRQSSHFLERLFDTNPEGWSLTRLHLAQSGDRQEGRDRRRQMDGTSDNQATDQLGRGYLAEGGEREAA